MKFPAKIQRRKPEVEEADASIRGENYYRAAIETGRVGQKTFGEPLRV